MHRIVVTGASGFLGSHLCAILLQKGYTVVVLVKSSDDVTRVVQYCSIYGVGSAEKLEVIAGVYLSDIDSLIDSLVGADVVFHCAALVGFRKSDHNQLMETNWKGTENVVNACIQAKVKNLVHTSSVAALGREKHQQVIDEDSEWVDSSLNTSYAISKHLAELCVWRGVEEGLNASMVNPGIILGPCLSSTGSGLIYSRAKSGSKIYPSGSNGFVGVEDVARLMISIYEQRVWGKRFVAVSENLSYKYILDLLADAYGKPCPNLRVSPAVAGFAATILGFFEHLGMNTPWPAHGLISTSTHNKYRSINAQRLLQFGFTPIAEVINKSVGDF